MPFYALSFCFRVKIMEPVFITSHDVEQEVITLSRNCDYASMSVFSC